MPLRQHLLLGATCALIATAPAAAQSESANWQFNDAASRANAAVVQDMIRKQRSGYYAAPSYTTNVERQYNCTVTATAAGNSGTNSTVANSPATSGANASATGNASNTGVDGYGTPSGVTTSQANSGATGARVNGNTSTTVRGTSSWQALNSSETNSGAQTATVGGSNACSFAAN